MYYGTRYSSFLRDRATREIRAAFFDAGNNFFNAYDPFVVTWVITDNEDDLPEPKVQWKHNYLYDLYIFLCRKIYFSAFLLIVDWVLM